jgi:TRAP-type C4-dicarboxylate transport system permease small subunit
MEVPNQQDVLEIIDKYEGLHEDKEVGPLLRLLYKLAGWGAVLSGIGLSAGVLLISANVIRRTLTGKVIIGLYEITEVSMILAVTFAFSFTERCASHISAEGIVSKLPRVPRIIIFVFNQLLYITVLGVLVWSSASQVIDCLAVGEFSASLRINYIPFRILFVMGLLLWTTIVASKAWLAIRKEWRK